MIRNYLKVALRYLVRNKGYTIINVSGLAIGITCCVLIMLFVRSEWSYDKFHSKSQRLYRAWIVEKYEGQDDIIDITTPIPLAGALQENYGEIEGTCRVTAFNSLVKVAQNSFSEDARMVDSTFFKLFDFKLIKGDRNNPFPTSNSVIVTEETSKKYFGNEDPMGKQVEMALGNEKAIFTVVGVAKSAPEESSIQYNVLIPYSNDKLLFSANARRSWYNINPETYVLLKDGVSAKQLEQKFPTMVKQVLGEDYKEGMYMVYLQSMPKIHLDTSLAAGIEPISDPKYSYILLTIGFLILIVACINFITLSVGRSATRALEVGVRKVLGAERQQLIRQFWGEAILVTLVSVVIGVLLATLLVKPFNQLINRGLTLQFDLLFLLICLGIIIVIGLIAGIYPALVLSGFKPIEVLKGKLKISGSSFLRRSLIAGQFVASIVMIIATIIIGKQLAYFQEKDLGYQKEQVVIVPTNMPRIRGMALAELYRNELLKQPQVAGVSASIMSFSETPWINVGYTDDKDIYRDFQCNAVDAYFIPTMQIPVVKGRAFDPNNTADVTNSIIVNEAMVKMFGWQQPIGEKLPGRIDHKIIGVVKDFHFQTLHTKIQPLALIMKPDTFFRRIENISFGAPMQPRVSVRLKPGNLVSNLNMLRAAWKKVAPDQDFEYRFLDESIASQYRSEQRTGKLVRIASFLSIFIASMGLFGLATLTVVRRTREIGIRKVLGANTGSIVALLSSEFLKLVLVAALIAFPIGWWAMNKWLEDFAYKINIEWWVFVAAAGVSLMVALFTVSLQAVKAAMANPVRSLRTE